MNELRLNCTRALKAAMAAVQPYERVREALRLNSHTLQVGAKTYKVSKNIHLAAFGKAALGMVQGAESVLHDHLVEGIASVPRGTIKKIPHDFHFITKFYEGATNNLPDDDSCKNASRIEEMAKALHSNDEILLCLLSGGGSALLSAPIYSITLEDKLKAIKALTSRGADIKQLNTVRKYLSRLKGGKLAQIAHPARVITIMVSDVVGDPINFIGSGPTVPRDCTLFEEHNPIKVIKSLGAWEDTPLSVQQALKRSVTANVRNDDVDVNNLIVCNNQLALQGIANKLKCSGYESHIVSSTITLEAQDFGQRLARIIKESLTGKSFKESLQLADIPDADVECLDSDHIALLFGGETTVKVKGKGKGGRNQEIVLSALSKLLDGQSGELKGEFALMSGGTDGQDGPTKAAGAVLTSDDLRFIEDNQRWDKKDVNTFLEKNDSYNFWKVFRDGACHIVTGPSGTNVMDVQVLLLDKKVDIFTL
ncbi:hypothetical protein AB6A40_001122 [Gnathostoma spinigerum]|uniref:Glycerate kinase n=1 Tax=Gnathostoma spinigerum TaxID=75299 RepID=A0ABD6EC79_9BILA